MSHFIIIGAGIGGLTAAIVLAQAGHQVDLLEAHLYPAGCAGQFFHQGYRFDAGATLAGGFAPDAPMDLIGKKLGIEWAGSLINNGMRIHLPNGTTVDRYIEPNRWKEERINKFGQEAELFWEWQEKSADALWKLMVHNPPWPPQTRADFFQLSKDMRNWVRQLVRTGYGVKEFASLALGSLRTIKRHVPAHLENLRLFLDGQLLISAQATTDLANSLYGAAALDLTRQGVAHFPKGVGQIGEQLVDRFKATGGRIHYRQEVVAVMRQANGRFLVRTKKGDEWDGDQIILNLPPWNIKSLLGSLASPKLQKLPKQMIGGWGAFMVYAGVEESILPPNAPLHQQIILREPLGEGNSLFLSFSASGGHQAPVGRRALTISTHTELSSWWELFENDRAQYEARKEEMGRQLLRAAAPFFPNLEQAIDLFLPGTPVTFQRYTKRRWGWVGGFPQTNIWRNWGPRVGHGLWMVGDTIFPGQSIPATAMGGVRVAEMIQSELS